MKRIQLLAATVCMALATGMTAQTQIDARVQRDRLYQSFLTPPDSIRVGCYYYWINERVDPKGVMADLRWMKDNGITLAFLATDIRNSLQGDNPWEGQLFGNNKFQSRLWWKNLRTALKTAGELDIEMGIFNCPGWSQSGGPWVKPEEAMRNWTPNGIEICKTKEGSDVVCSPCSPEATGLEVDKLSKAHVKKHFEAFIGEILRRIPPKDRSTLTTVIVDSWERGKQNYTDSIFVKFKQRFGYELDYSVVANGGQAMASRSLSTCAAVTLCCSWATHTTMPPTSASWMTAPSSDSPTTRNLKLLFPMAPERYGIRSLRQQHRKKHSKEKLLL